MRYVSGILAKARAVDPHTKRTIPVLTKPDLIDAGAEAGVEQLLRGEKTDGFALGFHMVKGRGQKDVTARMSIEAGLAEEEAYFRDTAPWKGHRDRSQFGTKHLRAKLADLQMELVQSSFQAILSEMKDGKEEAALQLRALGDIPSTLAEKRALFRRVREEIRTGLGVETLDGRISSLRDENGLRPSAEFHVASAKYQTELQSSKLADITGLEVGKKVVAIVNGEEVRDEVAYIHQDEVYVKNSVAQEDCAAHTSWKKGMPGRITLTHNGRVIIERTDGTYDELEALDRKQVRSDASWIGDLIQQNRPYSLPVFLNQEVFDAIVASQIEKEWRAPTMAFLNVTANLMAKAAAEFVDGLGSIHSLPFLSSYLIEKALEVIDGIKQSTRGELEKLIRREQKPYTQNHSLFETVSRLRSERLMEEVLSTLDAHCGTIGSETIQAPSPDSLNSAVRSVFERNQRKSIDEHMAEDMQNACEFLHFCRPLVLYYYAPTQTLLIH